MSSNKSTSTPQQLLCSVQYRAIIEAVRIETHQPEVDYYGELADEVRAGEELMCITDLSVRLVWPVSVA